MLDVFLNPLQFILYYIINSWLQFLVCLQSLLTRSNFVFSSDFLLKIDEINLCAWCRYDRSFTLTDITQGTACSHTSTMNQLYNGRAPHCLSSPITVVSALSEVSFPSFPEQRSSYGERELPISSVTSFGTSMAAHNVMPTCMLASNFTSDLHANNKSSDGKFCSGPYVKEPSDPDTQLPSAHSSFLGNSRSLMMDFPEVSGNICSDKEKLLGLFDCSASDSFSDLQNVTAFGQQVQDTITIAPNTHVALQNEWFSSGSSMHVPENVGSAESVLKVPGYNNVFSHSIT